MGIGAVVGLIGTAVSAVGTIAGANAQAAGLEYQAKVARVKASQEEAVAQRRALEDKRKERLGLSMLQARSAASGAGASDPTVVDLAQDIAGRGQYQSMLDMWQGKMRSWDYETEARGKEASAEAAKKGGALSAFGTILGGAGSMFKTFGSGSSSSSGSTLPDGSLYEDPYWLYR